MTQNGDNSEEFNYLQYIYNSSRIILILPCYKECRETARRPDLNRLSEMYSPSMVDGSNTYQQNDVKTETVR